MNTLPLMVSVLAIAMLDLLAAMSPASAAEPPASGVSTGTSAVDCKGLAADARKECERVSAKMVKSRTEPTTPDTASAAAANGGEQALHHSSPIMVTEKERVLAEAQRKGKDPHKAIEKINAKEAEATRKAAAKDAGKPVNEK